MLENYHQILNPEGEFELFVDDLPHDRGYLAAVGLEQTVHCLNSITSFSDGIGLADTDCVCHETIKEESLESAHV